ncbi:MAG: hypothetical protein ACC649_08035, partial [Myxococcota bacterium]
PTPAEPKPVVAKVVAPKPAPKPAVAKVVAPKPVVAKVVEPKPAPKLDPVSVPVEPTPTPQDAPVAPTPSPDDIAPIDPAPGSEATESSLAAKTDRRADRRASIPGVHKRGEAGSSPDEIAGADQTGDQIAAVTDADVDVPLGSTKRAPAQASEKKKEERAPSPSDVTRRVGKPKPADSGLPFNTITLVGIAAGALIVLVVAVRFFRRRSLPNDLDVTTFADGPDDDAAAFASETSDRVPAEGFSMNDSPTEGPAPQVEEQNTAAYSLSEVAAEATEPETGLYDEDPEGEKPMDMETSNLPTDREDFGPPPAAVTSSGDDNMSQLVQELAGRIANLETRLDEANDSRERLERQVAAQSEELRVQRAAIARTQRALRSLSRSEEDQATEPALREPSQPAG